MCKWWFLTANGISSNNITILIEIFLSTGFAFYRAGQHCYFAVTVMDTGKVQRAASIQKAGLWETPISKNMCCAGFVTCLGKFPMIHTPESFYYMNTQSLTARCGDPCRSLWALCAVMSIFILNSVQYIFFFLNSSALTMADITALRPAEFHLFMSGLNAGYCFKQNKQWSLVLSPVNLIPNPMSLRSRKHFCISTFPSRIS